MAARLGIVLYWLGCLIALLVLGLAAMALFGATPIWGLILILPAAGIWGFGRAARFVLAGT